jgi:hypothetical protein
LQENGLLACGDAAWGNACFFEEKICVLQEEKANFFEAKALSGNELKEQKILGGGGGTAARKNAMRYVVAVCGV